MPDFFRTMKKSELILISSAAIVGAAACFYLFYNIDADKGFYVKDTYPNPEY
jgi:hypothetical protein